MSDDLKTCPFCGGDAKFETYGGTACAIVCQSCGCGTPTVRLEDGLDAVSLWNRRAVDREALMELSNKMMAQQFMRDDARFIRWDAAARSIRKACGC